MPSPPLPEDPAEPPGATVDTGEDRVIRALVGRFGPFKERTPGDDAALLPGGTLVTTDVMVEGVHWDGRLSAGDVGWKLVAINVSDIGAMGGIPRWATLGLSLPRPIDLRWVDEFAEGLHAALARWNTRLVGGDTTQSPGPVFAALTVGGQGDAVPRSGARPGDEIWVTGTLGDASAGFHGHAPLDWWRRPEPPVSFGAELARLAHAMMDLSDGLAVDLPRLCRASGIRAEIDPDALPASPFVEDLQDRLAHQVAFGEDYQLLFTVPPERAQAVVALGRAHGIRVTRIGRCHAGQGAVLIGRPWPKARFAHFEDA